MDRGELMVFAPQAGRSFAEQVAGSLKLSLSELKERDFEDGEHKIRPLVNVRNRDVFVIQSLYSDREQSVNDKLCRLLFLLGALRDASAGHLTAVVPYWCYARKDRKTKSRDPVTTRYVAGLFESVGVDRVMTVDVHNLAAYQNSFSHTVAEHLSAQKLFVEHFARQLEGQSPVVASPDVGGIKRAEQFRQALSSRLGRDLESALMEKQRSLGVVSGEAFVGDVDGKTVIFIDDLISSGTTLSRAAQACRQRGATKVYAAATHGLFVKDAEETLSDPALEKVVVANTVPPFRLSQQFVDDKLVLLDAAELVGRAIGCIHDGGSIVDLLEAE